MPEARVAVMPPIVASAPGIHHEHQAGVLQVVVELLVGEAGLHRDVHVVGAEAQHLGHAREVDRHAAVDGVDVALERAADAERDDRRAVRRARPHDRAHLVGGLGEDHGVGIGRGVPRLAVAVVAAHAAAVDTRSPTRARRSATRD